MITIPGYRIGEKIYNGRRSHVLRARRKADNRPVILKFPVILEAAYQRSRHEFDMIRLLQGKGVIRALAFEQVGKRPVLVLEDFGGICLASLLATGKVFDQDAFLDLAISLVSALAPPRAMRIRSNWSW